METSAVFSPRTLCRSAWDAVRDGLAYANARFVYGLLPLLHTTVFLLEMAAIAMIARRFDQYFEARPIVTMMITNSILNGMADTMAQMVTAIKAKAAQSSALEARKNDHKLEKLAEEIHRLDRLPHYGEDLVPDLPRPKPFDFERLARFASWGLIMAPVSFKWYQFLSRAFPIAPSAGNGTLQAIKRVACDQLIMAPVGLGLFFGYMGIAEGGDRQSIMRKFDHVYIPTMKANYMLWPAVQLLNFRVMPLQLQLPFASSVGIAWGTYLSLANSSAEQ